MQADDCKVEAVDYSVNPSTSVLETTPQCSICRGPYDDRTKLDNCTHEFCFQCIHQWLKMCSYPVCPMCKTCTLQIEHNLEKSSPDTVNVSEIRADVEQRVVERPELRTEKRIVSIKCREHRLAIKVIDEKLEHALKKRNESRALYYTNLKQKIVSELNRLYVVRDDIQNGSSKELVVSSVAFRKLIYNPRVRMVFNTDDLPLLTSEIIMQESEEFRSRLIPFMINEFKAIPVKDKCEYLDSHLTHSPQETANLIFNTITTFGISSSKLHNLEVFSRSRLSFLEFCGKVVYHYVDGINSEIHQNGNSEDVVVLSDSEEIDDVTLAPPANNLNIGNNSAGLMDLLSFRPFQALVRLDPFSNQSNSVLNNEQSIFGNIIRPRPPQLPSTSNQNLPSTSNKAISWNELTSDMTKNRTKRPRSEDVVDLDDEEGDDVMVLSQSSNKNNTIVLNDSVEELSLSETSSSTVPAIRRNSSAPCEILDGRSLESTSRNIPAGLVEAVARLADDFGLSGDLGARKIRKAVDIAMRRGNFKRSKRVRKEPASPVEIDIVDSNISNG